MEILKEAVLIELKSLLASGALTQETIDSYELGETILNPEQRAIVSQVIEQVELEKAWDEMGSRNSPDAQTAKIVSIIETAKQQGYKLVRVSAEKLGDSHINKQAMIEALAKLEMFEMGNGNRRVFKKFARIPKGGYDETKPKSSGVLEYIVKF